MITNREAASTAAFVAIANSLVAGEEPLDLFAGLVADCARLLDVASAGLLLVDGHGALHLVAASSEKTHDLELFQLQRQEGPCLDCFHAGSPVLVADLAEQERRWPQFVPAARSAGFASVHAVPMQLPGAVVGVLGLFGTAPGALNDPDLALAQSLAHIAAIALVTKQAASDKDAIDAQLQAVLAARVRIEQAKGFLAQAGNMDLEAASTAMRGFARANELGVGEVARRVLSHKLPAAEVFGAGRAPTPTPTTPS